MPFHFFFLLNCNREVMGATISKLFLIMEKRSIQPFPIKYDVDFTPRRHSGFSSTSLQLSKYPKKASHIKFWFCSAYNS